LFYQEKNQEGMDSFMNNIEVFSKEEKILPDLAKVLDAIEVGDYILAADILHHDIVSKL